MFQIKNKDKIKLIASDFDGIFTDGGLYLSNSTEESFKKVSYKDIMGLSLWVKSGGKFAVISGDSCKAIETLTNKFNLEDVHQGIKNKGEVLKTIMKKYSLSSDEVIYIGDDINDISAFKQVSTPISVPNANYKVKELSDILITKSSGGDGVIREIVDNILY